MGGAIPQVYAAGVRIPRRMSVVTDLVVGAAAGAGVTWVMGQATTWMYGLTVETVLSIYERIPSRKDTEYLAA